MAPGDGEESDRYKRGRRAGGCEDGDGEDGPDKRCRIAGADGESGDDGTGDYSISGDEADGDCAGEDLIYYYSDDDEEAEVGASAIQRDEKRYVVLIEDDVHDRQGEDTRRSPRCCPSRRASPPPCCGTSGGGKTRLKGGPADPAPPLRSCGGCDACVLLLRAGTCACAARARPVHVAYAACAVLW